ncbi:hypothetical protein DF047_35785 [Burkholderia cenocepacia]|uniref:hypothetical protein n=1 Tax=Burkholderia cepacia complex TaxID=87882 RepID=UPI000F5BA070|nr:MULTISPECIES: hypothetical protein [Burkholderia cepacia complex]RQU99040.1 hypothetical protein DF047_35785 [Burkholderia cenocepacia]
MQLIVSAYSGLEQLDHPRTNENGDPVDVFCVRLDAAARFPHRASDLDMARIYRYRNSFEFSAGTYVMHDIFRERLAELADYPAISIGAARICHTNGAIAAKDGPFKELIDFSITSGTLGSRTSAKLADDFSQFLGAIDADCDHLFAELYRNWYFAFCLAENCGAVQLS